MIETSVECEEEEVFDDNEVEFVSDAFDDGVLMEVSEEQMKKILFALIESLESPGKKK